jgi:hypothetical protein
LSSADALPFGYQWTRPPYSGVPTLRNWPSDQYGSHSLTFDQNPADPARGAYGIRIAGAGAAADLLVDVDVRAPAFSLAAEVGSDDSPYERLSDRGAELRTRSGARIHIDREAGTVRFVAAHPLHPEELVHPYLAPAAAVIARWRGHESLHAGAIAVDGTAWALIGDREAGKSSTLAWLVQNGAGLVCDDMLVLDGERALPGPRSIDLRPDAAAQLGLGESIPVSGARERWRLRAGPVPRDLRFGGWVLLEWGDEPELEPLRGRERLAVLLEHRGVRLAPARPEAMMDYAELPAWRLRRPRGWDGLAPAGTRLLGLAGA